MECEVEYCYGFKCISALHGHLDVYFLAVSLQAVPPIVVFPNNIYVKQPYFYVGSQ